MTAPSVRPSYWYLLWELTRAEFKLRDQGTALGFLWTLLQPALMFAVLYGLFIRWLGRFVDQYAAYLLIGLVLWSFFQKSTSLGLSSFKRRGALVRNYKFPRELIVLSSVLAVFASTAMETVVLLPFLAAAGAKPALSWLAAPLVLLMLLAFSAGLALALALLAAEYRDAERVWDVLTSALFYLTPVFYPLTIVEGWRRALLEASPLTRLLTAARACLMGGPMPPAGELAFTALFCAGTLAAGLLLVRSLEHRLADSLLS